MAAKIVFFSIISKDYLSFFFWDGIYERIRVTHAGSHVRVVSSYYGNFIQMSYIGNIRPFLCDLYTNKSPSKKCRQERNNYDFRFFLVMRDLSTTCNSPIHIISFFLLSFYTLAMLSKQLHRVNDAQHYATTGFKSAAKQNTEERSKEEYQYPSLLHFLTDKSTFSCAHVRDETLYLSGVQIIFRGKFSLRIVQRNGFSLHSVQSFHYTLCKEMDFHYTLCRNRSRN